jgi:hypothetical protein
MTDFLNMDEAVWRAIERYRTRAANRQSTE